MIIVDVIPVLIAIGLAAFFVFPTTREAYTQANAAAPALLSFVKFAILATGGEVLAWRIKNKRYTFKNFGLFPKSVFWGLFGIVIYWVFTIFANGVPRNFPFLTNLGEPWKNILTAFLISVFLNLLFSPLFMTIHHISDSFITQNSGTFPLRKFRMLDALKRIDWERMWGFVFTRTIPFFWIPAHTVTFMLPSEYRMIFAAGLSVVLGVILGSVNKTRTG